MRSIAKRFKIWWKFRNHDKATPSPIVSKKLLGVDWKNLVGALTTDKPQIAYPHIVAGIVPAGKRIAVHDSASPCYDPSVYSQMMGGVENFRRFPGFQVLAQMQTQVEYMNIVQTFAEEITRKGFCILSADKTNTSAADRIKLIEKEFEKFNVAEVLYKLVLDDGAYGRAQYVVNLKGVEGPKWMLPLFTDDKELSAATVKVGSLISFKPIEAWTSTPAVYNSTMPWKEDFYVPESWFVYGLQIHHTRIRTISSHELPDIIKPSYNFAGMSLSQLVQPYVENWIDVRTSTNRMLETYSMVAISTNLVAMMESPGGPKNVAQRAQAISLMRDNQATLIIDKETEDLVMKQASLSGLDKLQSQALEQVCAASRLPAVKYTMLSPLGLNASSEGEIQVFYDEVAAKQDAHWLPELTFMLKIIQLNMDGVIDDSIFIQFNPLFEHDELDEAEIRKKDSDSDTAYVNAGILSEEEVRERLSLNETSGYVGIDPAKVPEPKEDPSMMAGVVGQKKTPTSGVKTNPSE